MMRRAEVVLLVDFGEGQAALILVLATLVGVALFADFISLKEDELCDAFVGVNFGGERGGVADFECHLAAPFGLERGDVDDQTATCVCALANANDEYVARYFDVLNGFAERERVGGDDDVINPKRGGVDFDHEIIGE